MAVQLLFIWLAVQLAQAVGINLPFAAWVFAWPLAKIIAAVSPLPASVALWSVIVAVIVGAGVGIIAGVYPASRASRLDPVVALRSE